MKVQKVNVKKFKALSNFDADINGKNVFITGDNGVGKSTFMQFIKMVLGDDTAIPPDMGTVSGNVVVEKDGQELIFRLLQSKNGKPIIEVENADGFVDSRKSIIQGISGVQPFNIDKFVSMSESTKGRKEQVKIVKSLLPEDVQNQLSEYEQRIKESYDDRTLINRQYKEVDGHIKDHPEYYDFKATLTQERIDISEIQHRYEKSLEEKSRKEGVKDRMIHRNTSIEEKLEQILKNNSRVEDLLKEIEEVKAYTHNLNEQIETMRKQNELAEADLSKPLTFSIDHIKQELDAANEFNKKWDDSKMLREKLKERDSLEAKAGDLTVVIETTRQLVSDAIKDIAADGYLPDGLTFDDEKLIWNGVPVSDQSLSTSEIIELGCKMQMLLAPEFGILMVEHGESLGTKRLNEIVDICNKNNWQLFMEEVHRDQEKLKIEIMGE